MPTDTTTPVQAEPVDLMGTAYYLSAQCPSCGTAIYYWVCVATREHDGLPVIPFDVAAQTAFQCRGCHAENYTGDFELFSDSDVDGSIGEQ